MHKPPCGTVAAYRGNSQFQPCRCALCKAANNDRVLAARNKRKDRAAAEQKAAAEVVSRRLLEEEKRLAEEWEDYCRDQHRAINLELTPEQERLLAEAQAAAAETPFYDWDLEPSAPEVAKRADDSGRYKRLLRFFGECDRSNV